MKYSASLLPALVALVNGAAYFTNSEINPVPGEPFELTWTDADGPVTILLKDGPSGNLNTVDTLIADATGGSFTFTLDPADYPSGTYAFEIVDGEESNYSKQFPFEGTGTKDEEDEEDEDSSTTASPSASATETDDETTASPTASATDDDETADETSSSGPSPTSDEDSDETTVPDSASGRVSSPLALILVTIAAMVYFN